MKPSVVFCLISETWSTRGTLSSSPKGKRGTVKHTKKMNVTKNTHDISSLLCCVSKEHSGTHAQTHEVRGNRGNLQSNNNKLFHFPVKSGNRSLWQEDPGRNCVFLGSGSRSGWHFCRLASEAVEVFGTAAQWWLLPLLEQKKYRKGYVVANCGKSSPNQTLQTLKHTGTVNGNKLQRKNIYHILPRH